MSTNTTLQNNLFSVPTSFIDVISKQVEEGGTKAVHIQYCFLPWGGISDPNNGPTFTHKSVTKVGPLLDISANSDIAQRPCSSWQFLRYRLEETQYRDTHVHMPSLIPTYHIPAINPHVFMDTLSGLEEKIQSIQAFVQMMENQSALEMVKQQAAVASIIIELLMTASAMLFSCQQQLALNPPVTNEASHDLQQGQLHGFEEGLPSSFVLMNFGSHGLEMLDIGESAAANKILAGLTSDHGVDAPSINSLGTNHIDSSASLRDADNNQNKGNLHSDTSYEIIEIAATDILAEYCTYFCEICGKGFKRDANRLMHMRAHGDNYKTPAALARPDKSSTQKYTMAWPRKHSCPYVGCKLDRKHIKFHPLKSMVCAKNHYKRSHCPKMYICNRCNSKKFSVLGDLKTHGKHCGQFEWQCSCGTAFSKMEKLVGHMALFKGHTQAF
eukprot:Gb_30363 [translate_table: standard]